MAKKQTVYFGPPLMELTAGLGEKSVSGRINLVAARYLEIVKCHGISPLLTEGESLVLANVLARARRVDPVIIHSLGEAHRVELVTSNHLRVAADEINTWRLLVRKLRSASFADLVAVVDRLGH